MAQTGAWQSNLKVLEAGFRNAYLSETLLRHLIRLLATAQSIPINSLCAIGRRTHPPAGVQAQTDALDRLSLGELVSILFPQNGSSALAFAQYIPARLQVFQSALVLLNDHRNAIAHCQRLDPAVLNQISWVTTLLLRALNAIDPADATLQELAAIHSGEAITPDELWRRRYMARAAHGIPDPAVVREVAHHLGKPDPEFSAISELPGMIAGQFRIRQTITFRSNATSVLRDIAFAYHFHLDCHESRPGEEAADFSRLLLNQDSKLPQIAGGMVYSDCEHPAVHHALSILRSKRCSAQLEVRILDLLCEDSSIDVSSAIAERYTHAVEGMGAILVVVPHVTWIQGAVLDIASICRSIKECNPLAWTIVDGAQAVGHIDISFEDPSIENEDIDCYIGCGHKWICGPESVGFARISKRLLSCSSCEELLSSGDHLTDASGVGGGYGGSQIGTNQRGLARGLVKALEVMSSREGGLPKQIDLQLKHSEMLRERIRQLEGFQILDPPRTMRSAIISFVRTRGKEREMGLLHKSLLNEGFATSIYPLPRNWQKFQRSGPFIRLSPGPDLIASDIDDLLRILGVPIN